MPEHIPHAIVRLLSLVSWISQHPGTPTVQLARHFGRSTRQIRRDIEFLGQVGDSLPGYSFEIDWDAYEEEDTVRIFSTMGADIPPRLTSDEATALLVGLESIAEGLDESLRHRLPMTALKVRALAREDQCADVVLRSASRPASPQMSICAQAIRQGHQLEFDYVSRSGVSTHRTIDPWRLVRSASGWLLIGWCHRADSVRSFSIHRINNPRVLPIAHSTRPRAIDTDDGMNMIRLVIRPSARWIIDDLSAIPIQTRDNGDLVVDIPVWNRQWFVSLLVDIAESIVDAPPEFLHDMRAEAQEILSVWEGRSNEDEAGKESALRSEDDQ
ncbi:WYL domain-containing protein [Schaalia sp. ZJ1691]|uniref:helix-turn-helix transcriptional regulator n=1 Tax=Schaalia sp. ZJ1691 TaxID=2709404 RepID=UPI0013ECF22B|nr:WYL domain-containing protein [Schaalia sp. ZJ1691]